MTVTKRNFYVFTGGPGSGKTTLINALYKRGFDFVGESGREIIKDRLNDSLPPRPAPDEFARIMFDIDLDRFLIRAHRADVVFFDRSFIDASALLFRWDQPYFQMVKDVLKTHRFNPKVFVAPPWKEIYKVDDERDQTFDEAEAVWTMMVDWYTMNDYQVVKLPEASVEERVQFVLSQLDNDF